MKEHEERKSRADEVHKSQSFREDESSIFSSYNKDFGKQLDQQANCRKTENEKINDKLSPLQQFKTNFISASHDMKMIDKTSKLSAITAISHYSAILQKVASTVATLPITQVNVERLFSSFRIIQLD